MRVVLVCGRAANRGVNMEFRNWIGIIIIIPGVLLLPIGWMFYFPLQIISFGLIFVGVTVFATNRFLDKTVESEFNGGSRSGSAMPGDVHDHSGWGKGGRSDSWSSDQDGGGD